MPECCAVCGAPLGPDEDDICDVCLVYYRGDNTNKEDA